MPVSLIGVALRTPRLVVRVARRGDAEALRAYAARNRAHLDRWEPDRSSDYETLGYWERVVALSEREHASGERARFLAFAEGNARLIASVNLHAIRYGVFCGAVLGYSVDAASQGRGLAREAVEAVVRFAFERLELHRLEANYQPTNERSGKLLRALGFVVEGYARDYLFLNGAWRDHIMTSLTAVDGTGGSAANGRRPKDG